MVLLEGIRTRTGTSTGGGSSMCKIYGEGGCRRQRRWKSMMKKSGNKRDKQESKINSQGHENSLKMEVYVSKCTVSLFRSPSS